MSILIIEALAVYGAAVATIGAAWQVRQWWYDRPHIRVGASYGLMLIGDEMHGFVTLHAFNRGKRSVQLHSGGLALPDGRDASFPRQAAQVRDTAAGTFPFDLEPERRFDLYIDGVRLEREWSDDIGTEPPREAFFYDAMGRRWTGEVPEGVISQWRQDVARRDAGK